MAITAQPVTAYQKALYSLLPAGEYWSKQADDELDKIIQALAEQLQTFDSQLLTKSQASIQTIFQQHGHSRTEYKQLLQEQGISVQVADNAGGFPFLAGYPAGRKLGKHTNRACIVITSNMPIDASIKQAAESHKQSHTFIVWRVG